MNLPRLFRSFPPLVFASLGLSAVVGAERVRLFDGRTLAGWEGETSTVWRVQDGAIVGGSLAGNPRNEFLTATSRYRNFSLRLEYKLVGTEGFVNGGVQFRSRRISDPAHEMSGYQADIGAGHSGALYDESRRRKFLAKPAPALLASLEKPGEWNRYEVICEGPRVRILLNGRVTVDYAEREPGIEDDGLIGLQIHGNCKAEIAFRNLTIEVFSDALVPATREMLNRFGDADSPTVTQPPWRDRTFALGADEVLVFAGQENLVRLQADAALEARLAAGFAARRPRFRSMAWEGDTVYEQWRESNFGSWTNQLTAAGATIVVAQFGQMEAFDGLARIPEFSSTYHRLLDQFAARTSRLVLLSPIPVEHAASELSPLAPDLRPRNTDVRAYADAVRAIAQQRGAVFVDLFTPLAQRPADAPRLTDNGVHLNAEGRHVVADLIARQLGLPTDAAPVTSELQAAIAEKNRLWFDCWRPANWSFVYGNRATQMFAKPAGDAPALHGAFERHKPLIAALDARIHALARREPAPPPPAPAVPIASTAIVPSVAEELASFTVADGFEVNLFASERDGVVKPTQMSWDEHGRLLVACSPNYPHTLPGVKPADFVVRLEDHDGDGRADAAQRVVENLTMAVGVEPGDGGLYVCDFDRLLHVRDIDGDGRFETTRVLYAGFGIGDTHQLINSIAHGPDGTLWFSQGHHAFSRVETPHGIERLDQAALWRLHPRTLQLEGFFNDNKAGHNLWGVAFDDFGQVFHKTGDRVDGYYSVPGMVRRLKVVDEYHGIGSLFQTNPKTTALDIIGTRALPDELQGCAVLGGYFGNVVELHRFKDDGAGFVTEQRPKLLRSSSKSFRPVDVSVGPDGAIYVADWLNPVIGHYQASYADPLRDRGHGRIWRISAKGRAAVKAPTLAGLKPAALLEQLRSPERWTRYQAKRLLFAAPARDVLAAADAWVARLDPAAADTDRLLLEVSGVYAAHETPRPALLARLLAAPDARIRAYGTRLTGDWAPRLPSAAELLRASIRDAHPRVRLEAVVAASYLLKPEAVEIALQALDAPRDRFIDYALAQSIRSLEAQWRPALTAGKLSFGGNAAHAAHLRQIATAAPVPVPPGKAVYDSLCLNCHQADGKGLPGIYPSLVRSDWISGDLARLIKVVTHGLTGAIQLNGETFGGVNAVPMPPMGLDDQQTADVLTWLRRNFGHTAPAVTAAQVRTVRAAVGARSTPWTEVELK